MSHRTSHRTPRIPLLGTIGTRIGDDQAQRLAATSHKRISPPPAVHTDDLAVDSLAHAQKLKLAQCRDKGRHGWDNPAECSIERLAMLLGMAVSKGDPVDIANYAAMLRAREAGHSVIAEQAMRALLRGSREDLGQRIEQLEREKAELQSALGITHESHPRVPSSAADQSTR